MSTQPPYDDYDDGDDAQPRRGGRSKVMKTVAGVAAAGILAFGASTAVSKVHSSSHTTAAGQAAGGSAVPGAGRGPMGTPVTADTLTKLKSVVTAKYAGASVEQAMQLQDGSYEVHVIQSDGTEVHVLVSKALKITGTEQGGPGRGMGTPVTGETLTKLKSVVTAKYAGGSVERANALPDGSYEVHVIQSSGTEVHVLVSKDFKITGTRADGGAPPSTGTQS